ncbi:MAG TPA: polyphosphate kinase 1 [Chryseolinea sp.]|nr:polyphosphate kinase 1 [Chryseolinea sp.]
MWWEAFNPLAGRLIFGSRQFFTSFAQYVILMPERYFDRDLSWLSFNERVLAEAAKKDVPLYERLRFLAIYSSNLDEFYRVRIASLIALSKLNKQRKGLLNNIHAVIEQHQHRYGQTLTQDIIPALRANGIEFLYNTDIPQVLISPLRNIFYTSLAGLLQVVRLTKSTKFFPENNKLFLATSRPGDDDIFIINVPSESMNRFCAIPVGDITYVVMIDDIIRYHASALFGGVDIRYAYAFKVTRDAELNLSDEVGSTLTSQLEKRLAARDYGFATRLLYDAAMPERMLHKIVKTLKLADASIMAGGRYHNLRDLFSFPKVDSKFFYEKKPPIPIEIAAERTLFDTIDQRDVMVHTPYQSYDLILRFFGEAAIDTAVERIYVTLYRIAVDSAIAQTLITAARNGKKVTVVVELKARFDEANNLRWAARMKDAGVTIVYSGTRLKVHAKVALVVSSKGKISKKYGLFATGNFNENTARLYTDHILLTAHSKMLDEVLTVFKMLLKDSRKPDPGKKTFNELIVAPFNIRERFFALIDREIAYAGKGRPAAITIKLNNLEEETLIDKLYEASAAGVQITLLIRGICRLIPETEGLSSNIRVRRIVDRYLEHGRIFMFHNDGSEEIFCGSADWMNRNIYHRIEVCFPVYDLAIREQLKLILRWQCLDSAQAVAINKDMSHTHLDTTDQDKVRSQYAIYDMLEDRSEWPTD